MEDPIALLARVPAFEALGPRGARARRRGRRPARASPPARSIFREGDDERHLLRRAHRPRARDARARRRPHDHARELRPRRHLRRAGDVRRRAPLGDGRGDRRARGARDPRRRHAPADARAPRRSRSKLVVSLGRRLRAANERLARQSFQTVQSRVATVLTQLVDAGRRPRAPATATCSSPPRRPTWRSSPAPRASRRAASWPCSSGQA